MNLEHKQAVIIGLALFLVTVPNICTDVDIVEQMPVAAYLGDSFQRPCPFSPDVVVDIDDVVERTVDAEPDPQVAVGRLDVDVGGPVGHGLGDEQIDELDDRRVLDDGADVREVLALAQFVGGLRREVVHLEIGRAHV